MGKIISATIGLVFLTTPVKAKSLHTSLGCTGCTQTYASAPGNTYVLRQIGDSNNSQSITQTGTGNTATEIQVNGSGSQIIVNQHRTNLP